MTKARQQLKKIAGEPPPPSPWNPVRLGSPGRRSWTPPGPGGGPAHHLHHGYTGLKYALLGSVAEKIVRHSPCPVLVVRTDEHGTVSP